MQTVSILNLKGGVGKTTTAVNTAAAGRYAGQRTLLVDLDPQSSATDHLTGRAFDTSAGDVLSGQCSAADACYRLFPDQDEESEGGGSLDVMPSGGIGLTEAEVALKARGSKRRLEVALAKETIAPRYDLAVVDTGPGLDFLWFNALHAADIVVCPVELQMAALVGLKRMHEVMAFTAEEEGFAPPLYYLPTNNDGRVKESGELLAVLEEQYGTYPEGKVLPSIRYSAALSKALGARQSIFSYEPRDRGAEDYAQLLHVILSELNAQASA